jgi:glycosyltransferase involved in cell wall biosynthesis
MIVKKMNKIVGIDATNIRGGGGLTHLLEIINNAKPIDFRIEKVILWSSDDVLSKIPERTWLEKKSIQSSISTSLIRRLFVQYCVLPTHINRSNCDILLVPGGIFLKKYKKVVTISQNLLPFEYKELLRYGFSLQFFKLLTIRFLQKYSFTRSDGIIFLTEYARNVVINLINNPSNTIINLGISENFKLSPRRQKSINDYTDINPFKILYVSSIDCYKHHMPLILAICRLVELKYPIVLNLIGPVNNISIFNKINNFIKKEIFISDKIIYLGTVDYMELPKFYQSSDLAVFSSSCENLPNILLEKMAAGLPIACSKYGPMPEILGDSGLYYDPEDICDIENKLKEYLDSPELRNYKSELSYKKISNYSWTKCSNSTFKYLSSL